MVEQATFCSYAYHNINGHCIADIVFYAALIRKFHVVLDLRYECLDSVSWIPVGLQLVSVCLAVDGCNLALCIEQIFQNLPEALVRVPAAGFLELLCVFFWG